MVTVDVFPFPGGGGQRRLVAIPPDLDGYNGQQLKGVSGNGKYTLYIAPLQEEIDKTPLPPEAKEFENMPKAPCSTCRKMFPLQILPVHIKSCKENIDLCTSSENENDMWECTLPVCSEKQEETAECPVCRKTFDIDVIESHASDCGLRSMYPENNVPTEAIHSFQSSVDVLNWIQCQVEEGSTFYLCVSRSDIFKRGMQQWQRQKKSSPKSRLKVSFIGEVGIDSGALSKEFLTGTAPSHCSCTRFRVTSDFEFMSLSRDACRD
ncbi:uncharacterized protein [Nothobranchius furzeri]|uniref:uncharacterized protein isoform X1 n=2 Tax=Nothobranchius furzeri TaxID=105023 RepID=UPI00390491CA